MRLKIEAKGPPASGKSTAIRLIQEALRERFNIKLQEGLIMTANGEHYIEIECELKDHA